MVACIGRRIAMAALGGVLLVCGLGSLAAPGEAAISRPAEQSSKDNLELLARVVTAEAQGEPYTGQVAVAAVIINRTHYRGFPKTIPGVVFEPGAFESVENGLIWSRPVDPQARREARDALNGWDPTNGAIYFFNPAKTANRFMWSLPETLTIGKHRFSRGPDQAVAQGGGGR